MNSCKPFMNTRSTSLIFRCSGLRLMGFSSFTVEPSVPVAAAPAPPDTIGVATTFVGPGCAPPTATGVPCWTGGFPALAPVGLTFSVPKGDGVPELAAAPPAPTKPSVVSVDTRECRAHTVVEPANRSTNCPNPLRFIGRSEYGI